MAGPQFKASGWKQIWWGKHWRKEWLTPVGFRYFDIDTTIGGLKPTKRGGGHQTKSLRMLNKDGREYILRTIDKDLELLIPQEFKGSYINSVINDQISTAHPYGPLAIASLTESIGSLHNNPEIVFVTDNPNLGEYRKDFGNKLCLFEERPSGDGWEHTALSKDADDVLNTEKLYNKLMDDNDRKVDQHQLLKIRLLDMLINDWDRHPDQWVWTAYKDKGKTTYWPFARDRDQAFSKTDGVNLFFVSRPWVLRSVRNFSPNIRDVIGTNLAAVSLDQQFTNELTADQWKAIIKEVQDSLSDAAIHKAVDKMPAEVNALSGAWVEKRLRERRDNMQDFGMRYYKIINKKIFIHGSDKDELFTVNRIDENTTEITIQKLNKHQEGTDTLYHRTFTHDITKEINLWAYGDNDKFLYTGLQRNRIYLRSFGGDGTDQFIDASSSKGHGKKTRIYDTPDNAVKLRNDYKIKLTNDTTYTTFVKRGFKYDWWKPQITPGFSPDDGLLVTAGFTYRKKDWHNEPYSWEQSVHATVALGTGSIGFNYNGIFKHAIGKWDFTLGADYKAPRYVLNFYGYGNETKLNNQDNDYFRIRTSGFSITPGVSRFKKGNLFKGGLIFQSVRIQKTANKYISLPYVVDTGVFTNKYFGGASLSYSYILQNKRLNPDEGIGISIGARYLTNLKEIEKDHLNLNATVKFYIPITKAIVVAHRSGGATNIGDYEFYQANAIGGHNYLRGYWRTRFTGQSSFYQNTDLRIKLFNLKGYLFRGTLGIYGFFDDGRVWVKKEKSDTFHTGYGGGIFYTPYNLVALNLSYGMSDEANIISFKMGFFF